MTMSNEYDAANFKDIVVGKNKIPVSDLVEGQKIVGVDGRVWTVQTLGPNMASAKLVGPNVTTVDEQDEAVVTRLEEQHLVNDVGADWAQDMDLEPHQQYALSDLKARAADKGWVMYPVSMDLSSQSNVKTVGPDEALNMTMKISWDENEADNAVINEFVKGKKDVR